MNINWQTDVIDQRLDHLSISEIYNLFLSDPRTIRDIRVDELRPLLYVEWGLIAVDPITGLRSGSLIDIYNSEIPDVLKLGISRLIAHLDSPTAQYVQTARNQNWAGLWHTVVSLLNLDSDQLDKLSGLHGGLRYSGLNESDINTAQEAWQHDQDVLMLDDRFKVARSDAGLVIAHGGTLADAIIEAVSSLNGEI